MMHNLNRSEGGFMPLLNQNKCYAQQKQRITITVPAALSHSWLSKFYTLLSEQLKLDDVQRHEDFDHQTNTVIFLTEKARFFKELDKHVGKQSTYTLKPKLLESLATLYTVFTHPNTTPEEKRLIASRIKEDVSQCSPGFTNRVNYLIIRRNMPQNLDELIASVRFNLVDRLASILAAKNTQGIHVHNRVIEVARGAGFGVWPINKDDVHLRSGSSDITDEKIIQTVQAGFSNHFQLFALANALREQLEALISRHGYNGKLTSNKVYTQDEIEKFQEWLNLFIPVSMEALFERDPKSLKVCDIRWQQVKRALLQQLIAKVYVTLSKAESSLLDSLLQDENTSFNEKALSMLILNGYELAQCLEFLNAWSMQQKAALVLAYLNSKSPKEQKEVLAILHNEAPQLTVQLKKEPNLQDLYFAIAIAEKDVAAVRTYVEQGANINQALPLLLNEAHKSDTLYWLHGHSTLLQKITATGLNTVITQGKYQGKTVAQTLTATKKGRQLLWENNAVQTQFLQTTMANTLSDVLKQAQTERNNVSTQAGFFKKPNPLATQLVQSIVYGDLTKSEALLKENPLVKTLLSEKVTVTDYSRRKVKQKTAFQAALCAMDDELCAMLAKYMTQQEMTHQYQDIFPKGHEAYYSAQTSFDFSDIVKIISKSSDTDIQQALDLELPNNTELWKGLEQFRADFTTLSNQESVFNPQHLIHAFELYDKEFNNWNSNQRDLFWRQVIGYVQRFLPANIAMDFAQGLYARVEDKEKAKRSFNFTYGGGAIFPLISDSLSGLGYEYAGGGSRGAGSAGWRPGREPSVFKTYVKQKQRSWENYAAGVESQLSIRLCNSVK
jgi:hypothetical protein